MSKPRSPCDNDLMQARNEIDLRLIEVTKKYRLTDIELLSIFHEEMAYSIKHIRKACR